MADRNGLVNVKIDKATHARLLVAKGRMLAGGGWPGDPTMAVVIAHLLDGAGVGTGGPKKK